MNELKLILILSMWISFFQFRRSEYYKTQNRKLSQSMKKMFIKAFRQSIKH